MKNRWNDAEAAEYENDLLAMRVYTSRLLGQEPQLVLHGGGNTSVKANSTDFFGETVETLFVKGSGWDLATIEKPGFAPERLDALKRLASFDSLSDSDMVEQQRIALLDSKAPNASVEAILHANIPYRFVDHTHANAVLSVTNTANGEERIHELYGDRVIVIPYVMPGFALAKLVFEMTRELDWDRYEGMILMNHGVFTFSDSAKESYERMIRLVGEAEAYLDQRDALNPAIADGDFEPLDLAALRAKVAKIRGRPVVARLDRRPEAVGYANTPGIESFAAKGPQTPDHSIFAKRIPAILDAHPLEAIDAYADEYQAYFDRNASPSLTCLDRAPRWAVWPGSGIVSFGLDAKNSRVIGDIAFHTSQVVQASQALGGWNPLDEKSIFEVEYWELEQAKLKSGKMPPPLQGRIALIALSDPIQQAECVSQYAQAGAAVIAWEPSDSSTSYGDSSIYAFACDLKDDEALRLELMDAIAEFGGIDILILDTNLDAEPQKNLLDISQPYMELGIDPAIVWLGERNDIDLESSRFSTIAIDASTAKSVYFTAAQKSETPIAQAKIADLAVVATTRIGR